MSIEDPGDLLSDGLQSEFEALRELVEARALLIESLPSMNLDCLQCGQVWLRDPQAHELRHQLEAECEAAGRLIAKVRSLQQWSHQQSEMLERMRHIRASMLWKMDEHEKHALIEPHQWGFVYLIDSAAQECVKIGWSMNPGGRCWQLQCASPTTLTLVRCFRGTPADERYLHRRFAHLRLHREWFRRDPEIFEVFNSRPDPDVEPSANLSGTPQAARWRARPRGTQAIRMS